MFKRCRFLLPDLTVSPLFFYLSGNKGDFRQLSDVFDQTDTVYIDWSLTQKEIINNTVKCGNKSPEKKDRIYNLTQISITCFRPKSIGK